MASARLRTGRQRGPAHRPPGSAPKPVGLGILVLEFAPRRTLAAAALALLLALPAYAEPDGGFVRDVEAVARAHLELPDGGARDVEAGAWLSSETLQATATEVRDCRSPALPALGWVLLAGGLMLAGAGVAGYALGQASR